MKPNEKQREVIAAPVDGALRVVAGAGTGKTSVLVERYVRLVSDGIAPDRILALTFTLKAASEMRARVQTAVQEKLPAVAGLLSHAWIMNFHQFGLRVLRDHAPALGLDPGFEVMSATEWERIQALVLRDARTGAGATLPDGFAAERLNVRAWDRLVEVALRTAGACRDVQLDPLEHVRPDDDEAYVRRIVLSVTLGRAFQSAVREKNMIDYADMILGATELFEKAPDIRDSYRRRFDYYLVDEFQDTDGPQARLLELLAGQKFSRVTVVGDDKQSIYRWRGARVENLRDFPGRRVALDVNYRSVQPVLDVAHEFISFDPAFADAPALEAHRGPGDRKVDVVYPVTVDDGDSSKAKNDHAALANAIAAWVLSVSRDAGPVEDRWCEPFERSGAGFAWDEIVVLVRSLGTGKMRAELEAAFAARSIPYAVLGRINEAEAEALDTFHAWLSILMPRPDPRLVAAVLERYPVGADDATLYAVLSRERGEAAPPDWLCDDRLEQIPCDEMRERVRCVRAWRRRLRRVLALDSFDSFVQQAWREGPGPAILARSGARGAVADDLSANLSSLTATMRAHGDVSLPSFLEHVEHVLLAAPFRAEGDEIAPRGRVRIMTIHQAKGLEFPAVAVAGFGDSKGAQQKVVVSPAGGVYFGGSDANWKRRPKDAPDADDETRMKNLEERCILYVAMTRAQDALCVGSAQEVPGGMFQEFLVGAEKAGARVVDARRAARVDASAADVGPGRPGAGAADPGDGGERDAAEASLRERCERDRFRDEVRARADTGKIRGVTWHDVARFASCPLAFALDRSADPIASPPPASSGFPADERIDTVDEADGLPGKITPSAYGTVAHEAMCRAVGFPGEDVDDVVAWTLDRFRSDDSARRAAGLLRRHVSALRASPIAAPGADLLLECDFSARERDVVVAGIFDRVERTAEGWLLIDYKFGAARREYERQIGVYAWALRRAGYEGPVGGLLAFVRSAGVSLHPVDTRQAERFAEKTIEALGRAYETGEFAPTPGAVCARCAWNGLCPSSVAHSTRG